MIVVRVELHSAITGKVSELARAVITNVGCTPNGRKADYVAVTLRGRSKAALDKGVIQRNCMVWQHRRLDLHVWNLVAKALATMGYGEVKE